MMNDDAPVNGLYRGVGDRDPNHGSPSTRTVGGLQSF
jgi:hypothetical protein